MPAVTIPSHVTSDEFDQALAHLAIVSEQTPKQRTHHLPGLTGPICAYAYQDGLPGHALTTILDTVTRSNHLDPSSISTLIKNLYPAEKISSNLVCMVVNSLGEGKHKPSSIAQNLLLKWIIMVKEILEDASLLSQLYGVLFNMLDMISIRATLCHLLSIITQRKHVKPFRIQLLLELSRNVGNEPALLGLLRVYKDYYPDVILDQCRSGRALRFDYPDPEWRDHLRTIQSNSIQTQNQLLTNPSSFKVIRRGAKRSRVSVVPEVHTYRADESSTTFEEIDGVVDFIDKIDKLELPNQMISALDDQLLQTYALLRQTDKSAQRIDRWLSLFFDEQLRVLEDTGEVAKSLGEVLEKVLNYTHRTKVMPSSVETFFIAFLKLWDGHEHRGPVLSLLAYLPVKNFEELQKPVFDSLETIIIDSTTNSKAVILDYYTALLRHWTTSLLSQESSPPSDTPNSTSEFSSLASLTNHASTLSLSILASHPLNQNNLSTILSYHETLAHTISHAPTHSQIHILTPNTQTIYLLTFQAASLSNLSRLCSILATYKRTFEAAMARPGHEYAREFVNHFNGFLMDICNLLWRSRAFNTADTNALGCLLPASTSQHLKTYVEGLAPPSSIPTVFSLSNNPVTCALSIAAFREMEDEAVERDESGVRVRHAGPVGQRSLSALAADGGIQVGWADYRLEVLKWLGEMGVEGIRELMFCTMKHLMGKTKDSTG